MARYIDADALADTLYERYCEDCDKRKGMKNGKMRTIYAVGDAPCRACGIDDMICELDEAPSADVRENVRGEWIRPSEKMTTVDGHDVSDVFVQCSSCGIVLPNLKIKKFCPNCGADMRGGKK